MRIVSIYLSTLVLMTQFACRSNEVIKVKNFRAVVETDDYEVMNAVSILVDRYHEKIGKNVIELVENPEESNSRIKFKKGLQLDGKKLGLGQWITTSTPKREVSLSKGERVKVFVNYGMDITFDEDNFRAKLANISDSESDEAKHLFHLFCHEIGHGMQQDHTNDAQDVMYPSIPDVYTRTIDFEHYFTKVRNFLDE